MSCTRSIKDVFHYLVWGAFDSVNGAGIDHEKLMIQFVLVSYRENKFSINMRDCPARSRILPPECLLRMDLRRSG